MKSVTEYPGFILIKALQTRNAMVTEGKTPEEIQTNLGTTYKIKEDKVKFFMNAIEVASQNPENLKRVMVMTLAEGESAPARSTKVDEHYYSPEALILTKPQPPQKNEKGGRGGSKGGRGQGKGGGKPKESPWGLSPEEKAAKNKKQS